ncbi:MAG: isoaspartyl peptidase/L-asparaginase family protein [Terriglobales bacterium]
MSPAAILVHGGCGDAPEHLRPGRREGVRQAGERGWQILRAGGSALDAVAAAVELLEELPLFNAGRGSVLNADGVVETDASIMDGTTQAAGAVACVTGILHPVQLARRVMQATPHVLLVGAGAVRFALQQGFEQVPATELEIPLRREQWRQTHGTVGAVACDASGHLAAATSTGGTSGKLPGRAGDTPLIGCGTWADQQVAVSCTGHGESIIRVTFARLTAFLYQGSHNPQAAADAALAQLAATVAGDAGVILADRHGLLAWKHNTPHMPLCAINAQGTQVQD